jgi:U-box domain
MISPEDSNKQQDLKHDYLDDVDIPSEFVCPLTLEIMSDPVVSRYGKNFERNAILRWIGAGHDTCPLTRQLLRLSDLVTDHRLRLRIYMWKKANDIEIQLFMHVQESLQDVFGFITLKEGDDRTERLEDDPAVIFELRRPIGRRRISQRYDGARAGTRREQNHDLVASHARGNRPRLLRLFRPTSSTEIEL